LDLLHVIDTLKQSLSSPSVTTTLSALQQEDGEAAERPVKPSSGTDCLGERKQPPGKAAEGLQPASPSFKTVREMQADPCHQGNPAKEAQKKPSKQQHPSQPDEQLEMASKVGDGDCASGYSLGCLQIWASRWGAMGLLARRMAAVTHHQQIAACLVLAAQKWVATPGKVEVRCMPVHCEVDLHSRFCSAVTKRRIQVV
jgi:hypothetical protein